MATIKLNSLTRRLLLLGAVLALGAGGWWLYSRDRGEGEKLVTATVTRGDVEESVSALGSVQPLQYVDVGTQVTGQLRKLHVEAGDLAQKGQLVAEIDPTLFEARVGATQANIRSLTAQLAERRAQLELARAQHARARSLFEQNAGSQEAFQQAAATEKTTAAQIQSLTAQIEQARSTLSADQANLRYTRIFAPMTGTVVSLTAKEGQTLVASQQAPVILRIADLSTMTVSAQVSEADVPKIREAMPVYFTTLGQPERRWEGKVRQILPTPEVVNNVVLYNVLFDVANPDGALKPQMSAQTFFVLAKAENALLIPASALQRVRPRGDRQAGAPRADAATAQGRENGAAGERRREKPQTEAPAGERGRRYTVRVVKDGKPEERLVRIGVTNRIQAQVLEGLAEGETVVVGTEAKRPNGAAQPGTPRRTPRL